MSLCSSLNPKPLFTPPSISTSAPSPRTLFFTSPYFNQLKLTSKLSTLFSVSAKSDPDPNPNPNPNSKIEGKSKPKRNPSSKLENSQLQSEDNNENYPKTVPRKPRRGRRSEAVAVEDFIRDKLEQTFESIRQQSSQVLEDKEKFFKDRPQEQEEEDDKDTKNKNRKKKKGMLVEEDDPNWPLDADIGWGIRASEYFDKHSIKNTVGEDGVEIDWEGELDDNYVKEINCLEWESFAFHPSPLIVLVFERYNRANDNWRFLKELEKAIQVYWNAKDRLPPRTVKIDINIERDLAYALKVRECPQLLFLKGNTILHREKDIRTADELVQMIAHFYYNARKPSWIDDTASAPPY